MRRTRLGDLLRSVQSWNPPRDGKSQTIQYIDLSAVDNDRKEIRSAQSVVAYDAPSRARQLVQSGDILLSTVRPYLNGAARVPARLDGATASTGFCVLRPDPKRLSAEYLFQWVRSPAFISDMTIKATGASYPAVSDRIVFDSELPLPSLSEQRRIAAILDQADALRRKRILSLARLDVFIFAAFNEMFGSKIQSAMVNPSNDAPSMPSDWSWSRLKDVARMMTGHTPSRSNVNYWNGEIPWLALGDIRNLDGRTATHTAECVTELGIENSSAVILPVGTVCVARTASVGFVTVTGCAMSTSQDFVNWVCGPTLDPIFLMWAFIASRRALKSFAPGSTHQTIYFRLFELLHVAVPPLGLQKRFGATVDSIRKAELQFANQAKTFDRLFRSLQHEAFAATRTEPLRRARHAQAVAAE